MKKTPKSVLFILILISLFYLFNLSIQHSWAEQNELTFENDLRYDVYYVLEEQMQYVVSVKIIGTVQIEGVAFLEIQNQGITSGKAGYIALSKVRLILPTGFPKPQNFK